MIKLLYGTTRTVILIHKYAIKIPILNYTWKRLLQGMVANLQEQEIYRMDIHDNKLCPVLFGLLGLFIVMPRCQSLSNPLDKEEYDSFVKCQYSTLKYVVEHKMDSFGMLETKMVAVDYGSYRGME